ncbi:MAG: hypothetical protein EOP05_12430 [Proteobacteria bacterium]|nr:MAG: hypothetical protein EOP05_12430 [Pseudomonadota bacterium]
MADLKKLFTTLLVAVIVIGILYFVVGNYGFVFSTSVDGTIVAVERVTPPVAIVNNGSQGSMSNNGMFSFAVAVRDSKGVIHTASSEDRQWAVARAGNCVTATFFPYAPWNLKKEGTYYNARLDQLRDCKDASMPATAPVAAEAEQGQPAATPASAQ